MSARRARDPPVKSAADSGAATPEGQRPMSSTFAHYPQWAQTLAHGIRARLGNTFILHGNTHDVVPLPRPIRERPPASRRSRPFSATGCSASATS